MRSATLPFKGGTFFCKKNPVWGVLLLLILASCSAPPGKKTREDISFNHVIDSASYKLDAGLTGQAFHYLDSSAAVKRPLSVRQQFAYYRFYCSYFLHYTQKYEQAFLYADSMKKLIERQGNVSTYNMELAEANYSIGDVLFSENKYAEAYKYFYVARQIGKKSFNPCVLADYSYRMGMILYKQQRFEPAVRYFQQSFKEAGSCSDDFSSFYRRQELINNTALSFNNLGKSDSALVYYKKAIAFINTYNGRFPDKRQFYEEAKGVIYGNQGMIYQSRGNLALAEAVYRKSIAINSKPNYDNTDAIYVRLHLCGLLLEQNRLDEMEIELQEVGRRLAKTPDAAALLSYRDYQWKYYKRKGDDKKSLANLILYNQSKDSIAQASRGLTSANASEQLDNLEKQYEIGFLKRDKEISDLYFRILIVIAILCLAVILLIHQNWKRSKSNITQLRKLNQQVTEQKLKVEQTLDELEQQGREKDRILRAVAHDLRNPIGGVASLSGLLLEENLSPDQKEMLQLIESTCKDALSLINEILEISVINSFEDFPKEVIDVNALVFNAIELLRFKATEKGQKISFEGVAFPVRVLANREKLGRVVSNLISNAIKFSRQEGEVHVSVTKLETGTRISVSDNGIGIPDSIKTKIFDTFTEAKRSGTSGEKPFGLGLSISKQIVDALQGKIWFESGPGGGSVFHVELGDPA